MRILYCNKYNFRFSGTEAYLFDAMEGMRACGHDTALFSMADPRGEPTRYDEHLVPAVDFKAAKGWLAKAQLGGRAIYSYAARAKMRAMIQAFRPDVAHVRNIYHHLSPSILWELKSRGVPVLYHVNDFKLLCPAYNLVLPTGETCEACADGAFRHSVLKGCHSAGRGAAGVLALEAYLHRWIRTYERCVDLILAPSHFVEQKLIEHGWPASGLKVLSHFQDLPAETKPNPGHSGHILYFGRLSPEKGVEDLLSAAAQLPDLKFVIAGEGPERPELERLASRLGLRNVTFSGHLTGECLTKAIAESQFTVFPSRAYETFGKSILESYAQARPVVASDLGSRRELVHAGETGLLYNVKDVERLTASIRYLANHPEITARMGEAGWRMVRNRYSRVQHFIALQSIYEELIKNPRMAKVSRRDRLRVAFIGGRGVAAKYSGVETWYEQIGSRLAVRGHKVTVYCRSHFTPKLKRYHGMRIVRLPSIRSKHLDTFVHTLLSTIHACFSDYDVVHYQTLGPALFSFLPRLFGKKSMVTVQGLDWQRKKWSRFARMVLKLGDRAAGRFPDETLVVSRELERYFLRRGKRAIYVPNGSDIRRRRFGPSLAHFGLEPDNYVLFLGRFSPEKNCDLLINAFRQIATPMKLVLAGGSSHTDQYEMKLRRNRSERIIFLDWLSGSALEEVLTNAAVFVLPSDLEGMSLALLDAMGAGICVLASDIPENREAIADTGFTFKQGEVQDFARMLTVLLSDISFRTAAGEKARARVRQHYSWDDITTQIEQVYLRLTNTTARESAAALATAEGTEVA